MYFVLNQPTVRKGNSCLKGFFNLKKGFTPTIYSERYT